MACRSGETIDTLAMRTSANWIRPSLMVACLSWASRALAQPAPAEPTPTQPAAAPEPAAGEPSPSAPAEPKLPDVEDSMLEPIPAAKHTLQDWRQALRLVRARSTQMSTARAQVEFAAAQARSALVRAYPSLTANGSVNHQLLGGRGTSLTTAGPQIDNSDTIWSASLQFRQPLLNLRSWHDADTAEMRIQATRYRAEDTERVVLAALADTIVAVVTAERLAEISRVSLRSSLSTMDLTRRRARLGASSAVDVLRAQQEVALNRAQVVNANEGLRKAREALGMALGYAEAWGVNPDIRLDQLARDAAQVCTSVSGVEQRSDVRAAQAELEVAKHTVKSSDYLLAPTVDLTSTFTYTTAPFTSNGKPIQWTIGGLLTIPLYDGGMRYAEKQASSAQALVAADALTQARRVARLEVEQARRGVAVAEQNFEVSRNSRDISSETSRLARLSFINGKATSFELVDATQRHRQAELDLAVKEFDVVRAKILALLSQANCDL